MAASSDALSEMRVLHVDAGRGRGSGPDRIRRLAARLAERPGVEQAVAGPVGARAVARLAREVGRWDLVHVHASRALRAVVLAMAASGAATRLVATRRAEGAPRWPALWRRADLVLAESGAIRDALEAAGIGTARIRLVPGGIDAAATMAAYREVLGSWRRRREHARWMERSGRTSRALPAGPSP